MKKMEEMVSREKRAMVNVKDALSRTIDEDF
jgi:hypothetical protein